MSTTDSLNDSPPVDTARESLQHAVPKAAETLTDLLDSDDDRIRIRAAEAILDRAGVVKAKRVTSTTASKKVGGESSLDSLHDLY